MEQKVLVVEDDVEINELLGEYLSLEGLEAVAALDGRSALDKANAAHPDAAILDLMLPDIDGYEVCRQLASHRATASIPVVMLTCMNQECDRLKGLASGAFQYMNKPFLPDDLIAQLRSAFEWKKSLAGRPPRGRVEISQGKPEVAFHGINEMMTDLFNRTTLPDGSVASIREGFRIFHDWTLEWGNRRQRDPRLTIDYQLRLESGELATGAPAEVIEWVISEREPGLLAEALFKPLPSPAVLTSNKNNGPVEPTATSLASWYQFLAKSGVGRFEKDSAKGQVRLYRVLSTESANPSVPVVTFDGHRLPTRVRNEAVGGKRH